MVYLRTFALEADDISGLGREGELPHAFLRLGKRVIVGTPERQRKMLDLMIMNGGAKVYVVDEMGYRDDVELVVFGAGRGVQPTGTVHGHELFDVVKEARLRPLIGLSSNVDDNPTDLVAGHFGIAIEVHGKGRYRIHPDTDASVLTLLRGEQPGFIDVQLQVQDPGTIAPVQQIDLSV